MRAAWWRHAIERRLAALTVMALVLWIAVTAGATVLATRRVTRALIDERASHARDVGTRIENALEDELRRLDQVAAVLEHGGDPARLGPAIRDLRLADTVLRLAPDGHVRWARSVRDDAPAESPLTRVPLDGSHRWRAQPTDLVETAEGPRLLLLLPARESDPEGGAIAGVIRPDSGVLASLLSQYGNEAFVAAVVDGRGSTLFRSRTDKSDAEPLLVATPIPRTSWSVELRQPRREALAAVRTLQGTLIGSSILLTLLAIVMVWGAARSIRQPVERLTDAAERLARGNLEEPIGVGGHDEIGRLGLALEQLRLALEADERRSLLLRRVLAAQEDERHRIARELHDETTQQLTALALQMDTIMTSTGPATARLGPARELVNTLIDGLHRVIYDLRPSVLDDLGLLAAIRTYARTHLEPKGIAVHCEFPDEIPALTPEASTAIYRVVQEALTNIMRHARAEAVQLACSIAGGTLSIEVEDDGVGFDPDGVKVTRGTGRGLGLLGMRERLALLGGTLAIDAGPGAGTRVTVSVPLSTTVVASDEVPA